VDNNTNMISNAPFTLAQQLWTVRNNSIGPTYKKAVYREYTDATFTAVKESNQWPTMGFLGPVIRAGVGDDIIVVFKNMASRPYTMHPHGTATLRASSLYARALTMTGLSYLKSDEGSVYTGSPNAGVPPGQLYSYHWSVPGTAGPASGDGSSMVWPYHSDVDETRDVNSGLVGAIIVSLETGASALSPPADVDREFLLMFAVQNENVSTRARAEVCARKLMRNRKAGTSMKILQTTATVQLQATAAAQQSTRANSTKAIANIRSTESCLAICLCSQAIPVRIRVGI
jgi:hypothetical protein